MSNLRIALVQERADQAYYPGASVTGNLLLDVTEPKNYKQISIRFLGTAYVHWTERHTTGSGNHRRTTTRSYTASEPYVDQALALWSSEQSPGGVLAPAQYNWPFSFGIPPNAPSSFEGSVGYIRFSLEGRVGTGLLKFDHVVEVRIPVLQLVSITDPRLLQPQRQETQKTVCCLCCASGPVILNVSVPKTGFCIGELFPLHVSIENGSSRQVTLSALITQRVIYTARGHRRFGGKTLISIGSDLIEPHATRNWDPSVQVPPAEIVHESSCHIIQVSYSLTVSAQIPRALNLTTTFPIELGNVQQQGDQSRPPPATSLPPPQYQQGFPPSTELSAYPPVDQSGAPPQMTYGQPGQSGSTYPPPPNPTTATPIGWSTQPGPSTFDKPPENTLADIPAPVAKEEKTPL